MVAGKKHHVSDGEREVGGMLLIRLVDCALDLLFIASAKRPFVIIRFMLHKVGI